MQVIANAITTVVGDAGIYMRMYLDDIIIISECENKAWLDHDFVKNLYRELGLPKAEGKSQPQERKWNGFVS